MNKGFGAWAARWRVPLGFAWGIAYLVFSQPTLRLIAIGGSFAFLGVLIRAFSAGFLEKGSSLATRGPYRFTRNPLYFGSFFIGAGFSVAGGSWGLAASFLALFLLVYVAVMEREAQSLQQQYGVDYDRYALSVPLFIPSISRRSEQADLPEKFRWSRYQRNREYEAALGYAAGMAFLALKAWLR
jgi:protein-S-isoprenylcysteine O-methyltransferase Ste14